MEQTVRAVECFSVVERLRCVCHGALAGTRSYLKSGDLGRLQEEVMRFELGKKEMEWKTE